MINVGWRVVAVGALLVALAGCGGGGGGTPETLDDALEAMVEEGFDCDAEVASVGSDGDDDLSLGGAEPEAEFSCEVEGFEVGGAEWGSESERAAALMIFSGFACAFGVEEEPTYVSGGRWMIAAESEDDVAGAAELNLRIAEALDADVDQFQCDADVATAEPVDGEEEATATPIDPEDLRPSAEVEREQEGDTPVGEEFDLGEGLVVVVSEMSVAGGPDADDDAHLVVPVRVENRSHEERSGPAIVLRCGDGEEGDWSVSSSFDLYASVPSGAFSEGDLHLTVRDWSSDDFVPCESPATIRVSAGFDDLATHYPVPDDLLADLNDRTQAEVEADR